MGEQKRTASFSAAPSAAGYLYQARLALHLVMAHVNRNSSVEVAIEALDDISFEDNGAALELLQTKHRLNREASLTDSSVDLWKTIRIWAEACTADPSLPGRTRFALITTGSASETSVAAMLRSESSYGPGGRRRPKEAAQRLTEIAQSSTNKELVTAFAAFLALTDRMRASLLSAIEILDRQPDLVEVETLLEETLRIFAPRGRASQAREMIEGWWWPRVCRALMTSPPGSIAVGELEAKLDEIRDYLKREALQLDFEEAEPSEAEASGYDGFRFIGQLRAIGVSGARIQWAKRDYYRAFSQRSKWTREHAVNDGEVAKFERRLVEEWQPRFESMCMRHAETPNEDAKLMTAGQELFYWVETEARFPFRALSPRSLSVGSYHILANDVRVGWHRDFRHLFPEQK
jgi:hypothetical protein